MNEANARAWLVVVTAALWAGCATQETVPVDDLVPIVCGQFCDSATTTTTSSCTPDPNCQFAWTTDVYAGILESSTAGACGEPGCHETAVGGLEFPKGDAASAYANLLAYQLAGDPYVSPCDPSGSAMLCNLALESSVTNPYASTTCGSLMPKSSFPPLTQTQLDTIAGWIDCGAPEN